MSRAEREDAALAAQEGDADDVATVTAVLVEHAALNGFCPCDGVLRNPVAHDPHVATAVMRALAAQEGDQGEAVAQVQRPTTCLTVPSGFTRQRDVTQPALAAQEGDADDVATVLYVDERTEQ